MGEKKEPSLREYVKAGYPCLFLPTVEPEQAETKVRAVFQELGLGAMPLGVWKATTGLTSGSGADLFTRTQLNNGAANSGLGLGVFEGLDSDIKNFYINPDMELNPQTNKMVPQYESFANLVKGATGGQITSKEAAEEIMSSTLPQVVKLYFIDQLPLDAAEKKHWYQKLADWLAA